jgi:hypothetical protein
MIITKLLLIALAGFFNSCMDTLHTNRYYKSIFYKWSIFKNYQKFLNPDLSAGNKWKNGDDTQGEKYFGSSTFLVWLTDGWHLVKTSMLFCIAISLSIDVVIINQYVDIFIYLITFGFSFDMFFRILWKH